MNRTGWESHFELLKHADTFHSIPKIRLPDTGADTACACIMSPIQLRPHCKFHAKIS